MRPGRCRHRGPAAVRPWPPTPASPDQDGRIVVDAQMRTSAENIYAAGDVALAHNSSRRPAAGRRTLAGRRRPRRDRRCGAAGQIGDWDSVPGFWTTIGEATLKYHAWGDGFDRARIRRTWRRFHRLVRGGRRDSRCPHLQCRRRLRPRRGTDPPKEPNSALTVTTSGRRCGWPPTRRRRCRRRRWPHRRRDSYRSRGVRRFRRRPR